MNEPEKDGAASTAVVDPQARDQRAVDAGGWPDAGLVGSINSDGVLARVRSLVPEFTERCSGWRAGAHRPGGGVAGHHRELAERSGTSPATVTRFCRALGFDGYADCGSASPPRPAGPVGRVDRRHRTGDPAGRSAGAGARADHGRRPQAMHDTAALARLREVERAAVAIAAASRVNIRGQRQRAGRREMQFSLHRIGVPAWAWTDVHNGWPAPRCPGPATWPSASRTAARRARRSSCSPKQQPRLHDDRADQFPRSPLAELADIVLLTAPSHDVPAGRALRAPPAAGRPRSPLCRRRAADPRTFACRLPAHGASRARPQAAKDGSPT